MTASKNKKKLVRELQELRGITYQSALNELEKLPEEVSWRAYIDRVRQNNESGTSLEPPLVVPSELPLSEEDAIRRRTADGVMEAVSMGGRIRIDTLFTLIDLLRDKTDHRFHIELVVETPTMLKTLDNEADALETIRRLKTAPPKKQAVTV